MNDHVETAYSQNTALLKAEVQKNMLIHSVEPECLGIHGQDELQPDNAILCHLVQAAAWNSSGLSLIFLQALTSFAPQGSEIIHFKRYL